MTQHTLLGPHITLGRAEGFGSPTTLSAFAERPDLSRNSPLSNPGRGSDHGSAGISPSPTRGLILMVPPLYWEAAAGPVPHGSGSSRRLHGFCDPQVPEHPRDQKKKNNNKQCLGWQLGNLVLRNGRAVVQQRSAHPPACALLPPRPGGQPAWTGCFSNKYPPPPPAVLPRTFPGRRSRSCARGSGRTHATKHAGPTAAQTTLAELGNASRGQAQLSYARARPAPVAP